MPEAMLTPAGETAIRIPEQLRSCRFIRVKSGGKEALDSAWQSTANYSADAGLLQEWIESGGNYGVILTDDLCCLDADRPDRLKALSPVIGKTLTIRTGRGGMGGLHIYFRSPGWPPEKITLVDLETGEAIGDIRGPGSPFYTIGPGCLHPSGRRYEIVNDAPLAVVDKTALIEAIRPFLAGHGGTPKAAGAAGPVRHGRSITDTLGLRVGDFLVPDNPKTQGPEIVGGHPVHGSETGANLHVDTRKNTWYCFRCNSGGGPLEALAVAEKIIRCDEAAPGCLEGHWKEVFDALRRHGYEVDSPPFEAGPDQEIGDDIRHEAIEILAHGDPLQKLRDTFVTLHSGDIEVIDVLAVAVGAQSCVNVQGIQPALTGGKGAGKTSAAKAAVHLFPREYLLASTFSNKALFYEALHPGMVLFSDDTTLNPDMTDLVKRCMSSFQEATEYRTVDSRMNRKIYTIPPRTVFLFTSLGDQGDDQLNDRQYKLGVETNDSKDEQYEDFLKMKAAEGEPDYPITHEVLVCRAMIHEIKQQLFRIRMPFFRFVHFEDKSNRRIMRNFVDFTAAVAALRFMQRERTAPDEDGVSTLTASVEDMHAAARIFRTNEDTRKLGLTREERALWQFIADKGGEIAENDLIEQYSRNGGKRSATRTNLRRLLYGRTDRGREDGGLLGKIPGAHVRKDLIACDNKKGEPVRRQQNVIVIAARPDITQYSRFYTFDVEGWKRDPEYRPGVSS